MKNTYKLLYLAAIFAICLYGCSDSIKMDVPPCSDTTPFSITATMGDLDIDEATKASATTVVRLQWNTGDRISVINLTTGKALGGDLTALSSGTTTEFSGTLTGSLSANDMLGFIYPSQGYTVEQDFSGATIDLSAQNGAVTEDCFALSAVKKYDGGAGNYQLTFNFLVSYVLVTMADLPASTSVEEICVTDISNAVNVTVNSGRNGFVTSESGVGNITITPASMTTNSNGTKSFFLKVPASQKAASRKIKVASSDFDYIASFASSAIPAKKFYNLTVTDFECVAKEPITPPSNEIWYTSSDGNIVTPYKTDAFGANIISNTYENGKGIIRFDGDVTKIGANAFQGRYVLTSMVIPNSVTGIGEEAFERCHNLTSINLHSSIQTIGARAFMNCWKITTVEIPNSVTAIEFCTFSGCPGLKSVKIPNSVTSIKFGAFSGTGLTTVDIPQSVTSIEIDVFNRCANLESFTGKFASDDNRCLIVDGELLAFAPSGITTYSIPNTVTRIRRYVFDYCSNLMSVVIPNSVEVIEDDAFRACVNLTSVEIPNSITDIWSGAFSSCSGLTSFTGKFVSEDNRCLIIDGKLVAFAPSGLSSYTIPSTVTVLGGYVFSNCNKLISIEIPSSVISIDRYNTFISCTNLTHITCHNTTPPRTFGDDHAFSGVPKSSCVIRVPASAVETYKAADGWSEFENVVPIISPHTGETVTVGNLNYLLNEDYTCAVVGNNDRTVTELTIPESINYDGADYAVTSIGPEALYGCNAMTYLEIPATVTTMGYHVTVSCTKLRLINCLNPIPPVITGSSFVHVSLQECTLKVPSGSVDDYKNAMYWNRFNIILSELPPHALETVTIGSLKYFINGDSKCTLVGSDGSSLGDLIIPSVINYDSYNYPVIAIGDRAFAGNTSLTSVRIPGSILFLDSYAFSGCRNLVSAVLEDGVKAIYSSAFQYCSNLESVYL